MTAWLLALATAVALVAVAAATVAARRRAAAREVRRVKALRRLAERLEVSIGQLRPSSPPPEPAGRPSNATTPLIAGRLPGRAALLEAVATEVERAGPRGARLTLALVRIAEETPPEAVREATGRPVYVVGPSAVAFTLPGVGRAGGLGALARIESHVPSSGRAIEREPDESAVELVARLLEAPPAAGS